MLIETREESLQQIELSLTHGSTVRPCVFREEHGRAVSVLVRAFGDLDLAEDAVPRSFIRPSIFPPPNPRLLRSHRELT